MSRHKLVTVLRALFPNTLSGDSARKLVDAVLDAAEEDAASVMRGRRRCHRCGSRFVEPQAGEDSYCCVQCGCVQ
jgi:hypothetical protein